LGETTKIGGKLTILVVAAVTWKRDGCVVSRQRSWRVLRGEKTAELVTALGAAVDDTFASRLGLRIRRPGLSKTVGRPPPTRVCPSIFSSPTGTMRASPPTFVTYSSGVGGSAAISVPLMSASVRVVFGA